MKLCWLIALALACGCSKNNSNFCANAPNHNCSELPDGPPGIDAPMGCQAQADCAGTRNQHQPFGHKLTNQSRRRSAQRSTHCDLTLAAFRANQQQAGHVYARDYEQKASSAKKKQKYWTDFSDDQFRQRRHDGALATVRIGVLFL